MTSATLRNTGVFRFGCSNIDRILRPGVVGDCGRVGASFGETRLRRGRNSGAAAGCGTGLNYANCQRANACAVKRGETLSQLVAKNNNYSCAAAWIICGGLIVLHAAVEEFSPRPARRRKENQNRMLRFEPI